GRRGGEFLLEMFDILLGGVVDPSLIHHLLTDQALAIDLADRRVLLDRRIHQRLGEARLVALVVAEAAIAPHVDHKITAEGLAELGRELAAESDRLGVIAVDVEDRRLNALRDVRRIWRRPAELRAGRKPNLVVDDEMDRSAGAVAREAREAQAFPDDSLSGEGGVAVEQD